MATGFDSKCYELAEYFMSGPEFGDHGTGMASFVTPKNLNRIAQAVQDAVEDELESILSETLIDDPRTSYKVDGLIL